MASERNRVALRQLRTLFHSGSLTGLTDGQLLERFGDDRGDAAEVAFAALVDRHGVMVLRTCRAITRDEHDAEDAFQATFLILARKGRSLWVRDSIGPWLHRVARRAAIRASALAKRRREVERCAARPEATSTSGSTGADWLPILHEEIDRLPDRYRVPVVLCDLEGRSYEEAARHMDCPIGTIMSRLARGRQRLQGRLTRRGLAPTLAASTSGASLAANVSDSALSMSLIRMTLECVLQKATRGPMTLSTSLLADRVMRSMILGKLKTATIILASVGFAAGGLATGWARLAQVGSASASAPAARKAPVPKTVPDPYAWRRTDRYAPPDFEGFFPDDLEGAKKLAALWDADDRDQRPNEEILRTARQGLCRVDGRRRAEIIRWIGGRYVWGKAPQNPDAIEIMYHATDCPTDPGMYNEYRHYAVYFGLSVVEPKPPSVLRALVDICMRDDELPGYRHENISRTAWGASSQLAELIAQLKPSLASKDESTRETAHGLEKIFKGKLDARV